MAVTETKFPAAGRVRAGRTPEEAAVSDPEAPGELGPPRTIPPDPRYPVTGHRPFVECPLHLLVVPVDAAGRLAGTCPECVAEAGVA